MLDPRGQLLRAAVGFAGCSMPSYDRALWALRTWLDSWSGIGRIAVGMHRQGFDLQLTQYDERGWRATFYTSGMEHSPTSATGTAWERTPPERRVLPMELHVGDRLTDETAEWEIIGRPSTNEHGEDRACPRAPRRSARRHGDSDVGRARADQREASQGVIGRRRPTGALADERDRHRWERTPWRATQRAAWEALRRGNSDG